MGLSDLDWEDLFDSIDKEKCIPFIGPEVCAPYLHTDKDIAKELAEKYNYPLDDPSQLSRVAQFLEIQELSPQNRIQKVIESQTEPNFASIDYKDHPYNILARLNFPIYITTNYDLFLEKSLKNKGKKPVSEYCIWKDTLKTYVKNLDCPSTIKQNYKPTVANPLVYHLNGSISLPDSMVVSDRNYLEFLIYLSKEGGTALPPVLVIDLASKSYLFIGYRLEDKNFLVMFLSITKFVNRLTVDERRSIAVQFTSSKNSGNRKTEQEYLNKYTNNLFHIHAYTGTPCDFSKDISQRWDAYKIAHSNSKNKDEDIE